MIHLIAANVVVPHTAAWSPKVAVVMIICNIFAIVLGKLTMGQPTAKPELYMPKMFGNMGLPALLATTSLGHIIGFGAILGLANIGVL